MLLRWRWRTLLRCIWRALLRWRWILLLATHVGLLGAGIVVQWYGVNGIAVGTVVNFDSPAAHLAFVLC